MKAALRILAAVSAFVGLSGQGARAEPQIDTPPLFDHAPRAGGHAFGPDGPRLEGPATPGLAPAHPPADADEPAQATKPPTRQEMMDRLFARLATSADADEAAAIASLIEHGWMESGSDTADLLMTRALEAMHANHQDVALTLLDRIVSLDPGWAEGWNKRATLRFMMDDDAGAMADIGETLAREPRHFGALTGMSTILRRNGMDKAALEVLRKAQAIYPKNPDIGKAVNDLAPEVEGRDL